jgi:hypothetical protein
MATNETKSVAVLDRNGLSAIKLRALDSLVRSMERGTEAHLEPTYSFDMSRRCIVETLRRNGEVDERRYEVKPGEYGSRYDFFPTDTPKNIQLIPNETFQTARQNGRIYILFTYGAVENGIPKVVGSYEQGPGQSLRVILTETGRIIPRVITQINGDAPRALELFKEPVSKMRDYFPRAYERRKNVEKLVKL